MEFYETKPGYRDRPMLIDESGMQVTYGGYEMFYETIADRLRPGTLLFLLCENTIGPVLFYLSCLNRRVVPLLLDKNLDRDMLAHLADIYEPDYMAVPADMDLENTKEKGTLTAAAYGYVLIERKKQERTVLHDDLALLLTTSGSTGSPRLVRQSRKNIISNARAIAAYLELDSKERPVTTLPMNYTYGLSVLNSHFQQGAAVILTTRTLFEQEFWDLFQKERATSLAGVPYTYQMLKRLDFFDMKLPSLKTMTQAGGKLPEHLHREFAEYAEVSGKKFIVMYGQTEATARMGYLPAKDALRKCGSMGIAIPGGIFRLMGNENNEISGAEQIGELVYTGDNVTMGYAMAKEDLEKGDERGGILFTGDMAKRDAEGYYYIVGRKKRFLKLCGKRINLDEIEQMMRSQYKDMEFACTGIDDHMEIYAAGADRMFCEIAAVWLSEKTGLNPREFYIQAISEIPKNSAGKVLYQKLSSSWFDMQAELEYNLRNITSKGE